MRLAATAMALIVSFITIFTWPDSAYADDCDGCALCASYIQRAMDEYKSVEKHLTNSEIMKTESKLKQADILLNDAVKQCPYAEAKASISSLAKVSEKYHAEIICSLNLDKAVEEEKSALTYLDNGKKAEGVQLLRDSAKHLTFAVDKCSGKTADAAKKLLRQITSVLRKYDN